MQNPVSEVYDTWMYLQNTYTQTTAVWQMRRITQTCGNGIYVIVFFTVTLDITEFSLAVIAEKRLQMTLWNELIIAQD